MPVDQKLLNKILLQKRAYTPPGPMPGMPGMDPTMMDPTMMAAGGMAPGGAPPMPPGGGAPMDPSMMMGGMPPMPPGGDPMAMAGGAPPPMDPSMVGGLPPEGGDPMAGGMPPAGGTGMEGMPIMLNADDLMALFQQVAGGAEDPEEEKPTGRVTNRQLAEQVEELTTMVGQMMAHFNLKPAGEMGLGMPMGGEEEAPEDAMAAMGGMGGMGGPEAVPEIPPEALAALGIGPEAGGGMPSPEMPDMGVVPMDMGMPKAASDNRQQLVNILSQLNDYR